MDTGANYHYQAFGLTIKSDRPLSAITCKAPDEAADVIIHSGAVPQSLVSDKVYSTLNWSSTDNELLIYGSPPYRYLVREGKEVVIDHTPDSSQDWANYALHGSVWGGLLHQRGIIPLHASAVIGSDGAWIVMGKSGYGKSSTLAELVRRGYRMLADDIAAVRFQGDGAAEVLPAFPFNRLWKEVGEIMQFDLDTSPRVTPDIQKYCVDVDLFHDQPVKLSGLIALQPGELDEFTSSPLDKHNSFKTLVKRTFRKKYLQGMSKLTEHYQRLDTLSAMCLVTEVQRPVAYPDTYDGIKRVVDMIESIMAR